MRRVGAILVRGISATAFVLLAASRCPAQNQIQGDRITETELVRRTQELLDSVALGNKQPWKEYFADDCLYFDEKGRNMDKTALVADVTPLPAGYMGTLKLAKVQSHIEEDVAIMSFDENETETVFGQLMTARYHETDTWRRRDGKWQIVAGQVLRYYEDPSPGKIDPASFSTYVGSYELAPGQRLVITSDGKRLYRQRGDQPKGELIPEAVDVFFRKGVEGRVLVRHAAKGAVDALIDRRNNEDMIWKKIE